MALGEHGQKNYDVVLNELQLEQSHTTQIFPESTELAVLFTAGGATNAWSTWAEIEDDTPGTPVKFTSKAATGALHICALQVEDLSNKDKRYMLEIAYGGSKTVVARHRFLSGETKKLAAITFARIRAERIPAGEEIYYRMKCETAGATCEISLRHHPHA